MCFLPVSRRYPYMYMYVLRSPALIFHRLSSFQDLGNGTWRCAVRSGYWYFCWIVIFIVRLSTCKLSRVWFLQQHDKVRVVGRTTWLNLSSPNMVSATSDLLNNRAGPAPLVNLAHHSLCSNRRMRGNHKTIMPMISLMPRPFPLT